MTKIYPMTQPTHFIEVWKKRIWNFIASDFFPVFILMSLLFLFFYILYDLLDAFPAQP